MRRECISCSCGHRGYTQKFLCASAWSTGKYTWGDGGSRIELLAVRHMPTLPEQSSYPTSRPQKGSVCLRLGWTWRSTVPSCWWSGRYIVLWKEHNESQSHRRIHSGFSHSSCLKFKKGTDCNFQCCILCPCRQRHFSRNSRKLCVSLYSFSGGESPQEWCYHYCWSWEQKKLNWQQHQEPLKIRMKAFHWHNFCITPSAQLQLGQILNKVLKSFTSERSWFFFFT